MRNIAKCKKCGDIIESKSRHDFEWCTCQAIAVDGGTDYIRRVGNPSDFEEIDPEDLKKDIGGIMNDRKYPNFDKWREDAIETEVWTGLDENLERETFLTLAPEDFYIEKDGEKQYLFTWDEAMKLEEEVLRPNGWRLPTCKEIYQLCATYIDDTGCKDAKQFMKDLKAEIRGYKDFKGNVSSVGVFGAWWSSTAASSTYARNLGFYSGLFYPQDVDYKGYGFTVRCVAQ